MNVSFRGVQLIGRLPCPEGKPPSAEERQPLVELGKAVGQALIEKGGIKDNEVRVYSYFAHRRNAITPEQAQDELVMMTVANEDLLPLRTQEQQAVFFQRQQDTLKTVAPELQPILQPIQRDIAEHQAGLTQALRDLAYFRAVYQTHLQADGSPVSPSPKKDRNIHFGSVKLLGSVPYQKGNPPLNDALNPLRAKGRTESQRMLAHGEAKAQPMAYRYHSPERNPITPNRTEQEVVLMVVSDEDLLPMQGQEAQATFLQAQLQAIEDHPNKLNEKTELILASILERVVGHQEKLRRALEQMLYFKAIHCPG